MPEADTAQIPQRDPRPDPQVLDEPTDEERLCRDFFDAVWTRGNADEVQKFVTPDFTFAPPPGYPADRHGYADLVRDLHRAFPDLAADLADVVACNGKAAARWRIEGTQRGSWLGIPATGSHIRMEGLSFQRIEDGKIRQEFALQDALSTLQQMGVTDIERIRGPV